jgi:NADH-quinone oxidoreductase subunit L
MIAMFLMFTVFGTLDFVEVFASGEAGLVYGGGMVTAITLFLLLGAAGKSAQIPLYVWLPTPWPAPRRSRR